MLPFRSRSCSSILLLNGFLLGQAGSAAQPALLDQPRGESAPLGRLQRRASAHGAPGTACRQASAARPVRCPPATGGVLFADSCGHGFNATDSAGQADHTAVLQAALNASDAHTVVLRNLSASTPWIAEPLCIWKSHLTLHFQGAFLLAKRGAACRRAGDPTCFWGTGDSLLSVHARLNVSITGEAGATLRMWKHDYLNWTEYMKAEWRMGIYLGNEMNNESAFDLCQDMAVKNLRIEQSGGDGIMVVNCQRVHISNVISDGNNRQGLSIIGARDLLVEHSMFANTFGTAPAAGVDIEPDGAYFDLINITIRNSTAVNNYGHGLQAWINSGDFKNISILVEDFHVRGGPGGWWRHSGFPSGSRPPGKHPVPPTNRTDFEWSPVAGGFVFGRIHPPGGSFVIRDSTVQDTPLYGIYVWDLYPGPGTRLTFSNVSLKNSAMQPQLLSPYSNQAGFSALPNAPVGLDYLGEEETGLALYNVTVHDSLHRAWMQVNSHWLPDCIVGNVAVVKAASQPACWINSSSVLTNLSVKCIVGSSFKSDDTGDAA
eukprot:SAG22_NODE_2915_length_2107_cov_2.435757_1_plen_544_part_10